MQVVIIGSGNVATVLGRLMVNNGHKVLQVWSRNAQHTATLAAELNAEAITDITAISKEADLYLLAVTDSALAAMVSQLSLGDKLLVHAAGSVSLSVLKPASSRYGVLWPMKMIRKQMQTLTPVTIFIDGNTEEVMQELETLAGEFSDTVSRANDEARAKMHLLAAITSNFTNHLYHLANHYCEAENIPFRLFLPLIEDTVSQLRVSHPREMQAGPAFRNDSATLERHRKLLDQYPDILKVYDAMTASIRREFGWEPKS